MELLQLRYFADAAETENFSRTARKNTVPQSAISQAIKKLELELGVSLFDRRGNRVRLNENGKMLRAGVAPALGEIDGAVLRLKNKTGEINGEVSLLIKTNRRFVTECISAFKRRYPDVNFALHHDCFGDEGRQFDLIVGEDAPGLKNAQRQRLVTENILLAVSAGHPLAKRKTADIAELRGERFVSMPVGSSLHKTLVSVCGKGGFEPGIAIRCDDPYYLREYVAMNLGIAVFPEFSWQGLFDDRVALLKIEGEPLTRSTYVYWKSAKYLSAASELFRAHLIERFARKDGESL